MANSHAVVSVLLSAALLCQPLFAFQAPLSDTAVREAYFLGQRHDESVAAFFARYAKSLPEPAFGPDIAVVRLLTPYAQVVSESANHLGNYSAQRAEKDHQADSETVVVSVDIYFTDSYGPYVAAPARPPASSATSFIRRSSDFWRDFAVSVIFDSRPLSPQELAGEPIYHCFEGGCSLTGATISLTFAAKDFPSDTVTIRVLPPQGDEVNADFDLSQVR